MNNSKSAFSSLFPTRGSARGLSLLTAIALLFGFGTAETFAAKRPTTIDAVPTITGIAIENGQLVASGFVTATIKGKRTTSVPFSGIPVSLSLAANQTPAADQAVAALVECPVLDLSLGPIEVNLLGLVVETSPICLQLTALGGGGLLGDLLCAVANLLNGGLSLPDILNGLGIVDPVTGTELVPGLTQFELGYLVGSLTGLLNGALDQILDAVLTLISNVDIRRTCSILHLELGPLDLNLLGLEVLLNNCSGGPVVVDITAQTGGGQLLGNLLCGLLDGGLLDLGATLGDILGLLALLR